jgi:dienelactone hydrolase
MTVSRTALCAFVAASLTAALSFAWPARAQPSEPVKTSITGHGFVADLYAPADMASGKRPAIIVFGGSEGGLGAGAAQDAQLLAKHGYVVLQLAYFDAPGLRKELGLIPLEYFGTAIDWLRAQASVDPDRIGVEGTSIGGEVALVVASPSSVVWPGISQTSASPPSTFTLAGQPLPDTPYGWAGPSTTIFQLYALGLNALDQHKDAIIPVERINGPVMLVCGEADTLWPSCPMSRQVRDRLSASGFGHAVTLLSYPGAGHASFGPPRDGGGAPGWAALGGTPEGNQAARMDDWPKSVAFMDSALKR